MNYFTVSIFFIFGLAGMLLGLYTGFSIKGFQLTRALEKRRQLERKKASVKRTRTPKTKLKRLNLWNPFRKIQHRKSHNVLNDRVLKDPDGCLQYQYCMNEEENKKLLHSKLDTQDSSYIAAKRSGK